jgi:hypothetical protein
MIVISGFCNSIIACFKFMLNLSTALLYGLVVNQY